MSINELATTSYISSIIILTNLLCIKAVTILLTDISSVFRLLLYKPIMSKILVLLFVCCISSSYGAAPKFNENRRAFDYAEAKDLTTTAEDEGPYAAAGKRPGKEFNLPTEDNVTDIPTELSTGPPATVYGAPSDVDNQASNAVDGNETTDEPESELLPSAQVQLTSAKQETGGAYIVQLADNPLQQIFYLSSGNDASAKLQSPVFQAVPSNPFLVPRTVAYYPQYHTWQTL